MSNHYHLLIETPDGNLSKGMRQLNDVFTQASNRRHQRSGHLFQGRYNAVLVDADTYLMELMRYIILNPVRACMVDQPGQWPWSSYNATVGETSARQWLATDKFLAQFAGNRNEAVQGYSQFVAQGIGHESIWRHLNRQVFLGDDHFVQQMQQKTKVLSENLNIPNAQRRPPAPPLEKIVQVHADHNDAIVAMYTTGEYSCSQIAAFFNLHFTTVGKIVRAVKADIGRKGG